ncbi:TauD/TfdA family dioxygenase [Sphingomonas sp. CFBP 13720]|nr:TauD/TfdA family dioxygenase [Sphingomonas sp. CFBP 13720]
MRPERGGEIAKNATIQILDMYTYLHVHYWKKGEFLILDNWLVLHGRGDGGDQAISRCLERRAYGAV